MKISKGALKSLISEEVKKLQKIDLLKEEKAKLEEEFKLLNEQGNKNELQQVLQILGNFYNQPFPYSEDFKRKTIGDIHNDFAKLSQPQQQTAAAAMEEGIFGNKNSTSPEAEKAKNEIESFNFERVFFQPAEPVTNSSILELCKMKLRSAANEMPTVAILLPKYFEVRGKSNSTHAQALIGGEVVDGYIPMNFPYLSSLMKPVITPESQDRMKRMMISELGQASLEEIFNSD